MIAVLPCYDHRVRHIANDVPHPPYGHTLVTYDISIGKWGNADPTAEGEPR